MKQRCVNVPKSRVSATGSFSGRSARPSVRPLSGAKQTSLTLVSMSANDPKRTYGPDTSAKRIVRRLKSYDAADQKHQDLIRDVFGRNRCEWRGDDAHDDEGFSYWRFCPLVGRAVERVVEMLQLPKKDPLVGNHSGRR